MSNMSNIKLETHKDHVVRTSPAIRMDMSNIEVSENPSKEDEEKSRNTRNREDDERKERRRDDEDRRGRERNRIDLIPEKKSADIDSADEGEAADIGWLVNSKKAAPATEVSIPDSEPSKALLDPFGRDPFDKDPFRRAADSMSERSRKSSEKRSPALTRRTSAASSYSRKYDPLPETVIPVKPGTTPFDNFPRASEIFATTVIPTERILYENMTEDEKRTLKSDFLQQYEEKNKDQRYSSKRFTMRDDIEDIRGELELVKQKRMRKSTFNSYQNRLFLVVKVIVAVNNWFEDPYELELNKWQEDVYDEIKHGGEYDELLDELVEKYKTMKPWPVELRLAFALGSGLVLGVMSRKEMKAAQEKLAEQDRLMNAKIDARVQASTNAAVEQIMRKMNADRQNSNNGINVNLGRPLQQQQQTQRMQVPSMPGQNVIYQQQTSAMLPDGRNVTRTANLSANLLVPVATEEKLQGPTLTESDFIKMMRENCVDSTDDSSDASSVKDKSKTENDVDKDGKSVSSEVSSTSKAVTEHVSIPISSVPPKNGKPRGGKTTRGGRTKKVTVSTVEAVPAVASA